MAKTLAILALSLALVMTFVGNAHAKSKENKSATVTGTAVQVTTTHITVEVTDDKTGKTKRMPFQLTKDTTYTGGELVQGATVTVTYKSTTATSVDVAAPKTK